MMEPYESNIPQLIRDGLAHIRNKGQEQRGAADVHVGDWLNHKRGFGCGRVDRVHNVPVNREGSVDEKEVISPLMTKEAYPSVLSRP